MCFGRYVALSLNTGKGEGKEEDAQGEKPLWRKDQIVGKLWIVLINVMSLLHIAAQVNIIGLLCVSNDP